MGCLHDTANIPTIRLRVGEGRSHPERESSPHPTHTGAKLLRRDAPSAGRSADPLERVLLSGFFCQATSTGGGAHHLTLLGRAVPPILPLLEGKGKGSHAYDSMAIRRLRPSSHARIFYAPGIFYARIFGDSGRLFSFWVSRQWISRWRLYHRRSSHDWRRSA